LSLNIKIKELEKNRNELLLAVNKYENDLKYLQENERIRENDYLEALENLHMERNNMKKMIEYKENSFDLRTPLEKNVEKRLTNNNNYDYQYDNDKHKLDLFYGFFNQLENLVLNKVTSVVYLDKLEANVLNIRLEEMLKNISGYISKINENKEGEKNNDNKDITIDQLNKNNQK